jgi:superfamily II DNA/RNA helicase
MPAKEHRQTVMFSATFPKRIEKLVDRFLRPDHTYRLTIGKRGGACEHIIQVVKDVSYNLRNAECAADIRALSAAAAAAAIEADIAAANATTTPSDSSGSAPSPEVAVGATIVFVEKHKTCFALAGWLNQQGFSAVAIHGKMEQWAREEAITKIRAGEANVLVGTSLAARGIDIANVAQVINYDLPKDVGTYTHRIGRTGRAGHEGRAVSYYSDRTDGKIGRPLCQLLHESEQEVPAWLAQLARWRAPPPPRDDDDFGRDGDRRGGDSRRRSRSRDRDRGRRSRSRERDRSPRRGDRTDRGDRGSDRGGGRDRGSDRGGGRDSRRDDDRRSDHRERR